MQFQTFLDPFGSALRLQAAGLANTGKAIDNATNLYRLGMVQNQYKEMVDDIAQSRQGFAAAGGTDPGTPQTIKDGSSAPDTGPTSKDMFKLYLTNLLESKRAAWNPQKQTYYANLAKTYLERGMQLQKDEVDQRRTFMDDFANAAETAAKSPEDQGRALAELQQRLPPNVSLDKVLKGAGLQVKAGQVVWNPEVWEALAKHSKNYIQEQAQKEKMLADRRAEIAAENQARRLDAYIASQARAEASARDREKHAEELEKSREKAQETREKAQELVVSKEYNQESKDFQGRAGIRTSYETAERYVIDPKTGKPYPTPHYDAEKDNALVYAYISAIHPEHRGSVTDLKQISKLTALPARFSQEIKSLINGKELSEQTRLNMFDAIKEKFLTENQQQKQRESSSRFKIRMINPDLTDTDVDALIPKYSLGPDELGLDYFKKKHGEE